jgi:FkbM family methyltransferase
MIKPLVRKLFPRKFRLLVAHCWFHRRKLLQPLQPFASDLRNLGIPAAVILLLSPLFSLIQRRIANQPTTIRRLKPKGYSHPFYYREGTSDRAVIRQVLSRRDYEGVCAERDAALIIDCGANIGCSSYYFLNRYPKARVLAIEPDWENYQLCRRNLKPFRDRVTVMQAGLWSDCLPLRVVRGGFLDGQAWSFQVRPCLEYETPDLISTTMDQLIAMAGESRVDILKMDIEAAEKEVFRTDPGHWLGCVRHLAIELHDDEAEAIFKRATANFNCYLERSGDLTFCKNLTPKSSSKA